MKTKILLVGGGGREGAFAQSLAAEPECELHAMVSHANPTILRCVHRSGGSVRVGAPADAAAVAAFAKEAGAEFAFVSADEPLAKGVVDALLQVGVVAVGGSQDATRIEWDKVYSIGLMQEECPEFTPFHRVVSTPAEVESVLTEFKSKNLEIVVKPQGLTGGKGVKVMPAHLPDYAAAAAYAQELLSGREGEKVLLVEKLHGVEFTIMGLTDGEHLVIAPATYDYPYRLEGDQGPGTGGMGCFTAATPRLPFMTEAHWQDCRTILQRILNRMRADGLEFTGVLNGGFFLTAQGIRFMEFNGRFGDPEALNILPLLATPFSQVIMGMACGTLALQEVQFKPMASVVKYLVAEEYPNASPHALDFTVDEAAIAAAGITLTYASCVAAEGAEQGGGAYRTLKSSRVLALTALAESIADASERINAAIDAHVQGNLHYRRDIGSAAQVQHLSTMFNG